MTKRKRPYDSSDEQDVAAAKRKEHNETQAEIHDIRSIMRTKEGRRFMWRLLGKCGVYQTSFSIEALQMAFKEGRRDIGLYHLDLLMRACPDAFQVMEREQMQPRGDDE